MTDDGTGEEGFLARWSRRKRQAAAVSRSPADAPAAAPSPAAAVPPDSGAPDSPAAHVPPPPAAPGPASPPPAVPLDPATLPPIESLTAESDISAFLRQEVPRALREAALRRVWTLDPAIRDFIGPADYAWDFNAPDAMPGFSATLTGDVRRLVAQATGGAVGDAAAAPPPSVEPDRLHDAAAVVVPVSPEPRGPAAEPAVSEAAPGRNTAVPPRRQAPERSAARRHGGARPA